MTLRQPATTAVGRRPDKMSVDTDVDTRKFDVSVVIPALNAADHIADAIRSAANQRPCFKQIIVIDDGSTDDTESVVKSMNVPDVIYHYQPHSGQGSARNAGIALATATFLCFLDADDLLASNATQVMATTIFQESHAIDAFLFSANVVRKSGDRRVPSNFYRRRNSGCHASGKAVLTIELGRNSFLASPCLYVFRRTLLEEKPILRFNRELHEDESFTPALLLRCGPTVVRDMALYERTVRAGSVMARQASDNNVRGMLCAAQVWLELAPSMQGFERRLFLQQAHRCYCAGLRYAARARLGRHKTTSLVSQLAPAFWKYVAFDYTVASLSKRIAFDLGQARAKIVTALPTISPKPPAEKDEQRPVQ